MTRIKFDVCYDDGPDDWIYDTFYVSGSDTVEAVLEEARECLQFVKAKPEFQRFTWYLIKETATRERL